MTISLQTERPSQRRRDCPESPDGTAFATFIDYRFKK